MLSEHDVLQNIHSAMPMLHAEDLAARWSFDDEFMEGCDNRPNAKEQACVVLDSSPKGLKTARALRNMLELSAPARKLYLKFSCCAACMA